MNKLQLIISMIVLAVVLTACNVTVQSAQQQQPNTISVSGTAQLKAAPDEATVMLNVETNGTTPREAQDKNSAAMSAAIAALRRAGVAEDQIQTTNYQLIPNTYWDYKNQQQITSGYKTMHTLQLKTKDLSRVGDLIQTAVDAGATGVESVSFSLSKANERDVKDAALRSATEDARQKAGALADGLDVRLGKVSSVSINEYNVMPYYRADAGMMTKAEAAPAPPIAPQDVDVSANVQVVFEIA
jgi:uncharacterized protein YggE